MSTGFKISPVQYVSLCRLLPAYAEAYSPEFGMMFLEKPELAAQILKAFEATAESLRRRMALAHLGALLPIDDQLWHLMLLFEVCLKRFAEDNVPDANTWLDNVRAFHQATREGVHRPDEFFRTWQETYPLKITARGVPSFHASHCMHDITDSVTHYYHQNEDLSEGEWCLYAIDCWTLLNPTEAEEDLLANDLLTRIQHYLAISGFEVYDA